jgi:predicted DNA-binding transcriptional regulator YafY
VRRDLDALQAAGFDVGPQDVQRGRVWKLGPLHRSSHKVTTTATELMALSLGRDLLLPMMGTPFWTGIESFWHKIQESLPEAVWNHYEKYRAVLHVLGTPAKTYEKQRGILKTINRSILEHRRVQIEYQSLGSPQPSQRCICPYALALYQSSIYVIATTEDDPKNDAPLRHFKLDRFRKAVALDEWFKPRRDVDVRRHLSESIGIFSGSSPRNFRIKISSLAARWVLEDPWHPEQSVTRHADGSITLSVKAAHDLEIIPRVLALGKEAEMLSPASARGAIRETIRQLESMYRD